MFPLSKNEDRHEDFTFLSLRETVNLDQISDWLLICDYYLVLILIISLIFQSLPKHHRIYSTNFIKYLNLDLSFFVIYHFVFINY